MAEPLHTSVLTTYRRMLQLAQRLPDADRAGAVAQIRTAFRAGAPASATSSSSAAAAAAADREAATRELLKIAHQKISYLKMVTPRVGGGAGGMSDVAQERLRRGAGGAAGAAAGGAGVGAAGASGPSPTSPSTILPGRRRYAMIEGELREVTEGMAEAGALEGLAVSRTGPSASALVGRAGLDPDHVRRHNANMDRFRFLNRAPVPPGGGGSRGGR